jgi:hypothetical protein
VKEKTNNLTLTHNSALVAAELTSTDIRLKNGYLFEAYNTISVQNASPTLVAHLRSEGYDPSRFTFIAPDICGYTLR